MMVTRFNQANRVRFLAIFVVFIGFSALFLCRPHSSQASFSNRTPHCIVVDFPKDIDRLIQLGLDIDRVSGNTVTAYLSPSERKRVEALAFEVQEIPDAAKKAHDLYYGKKPKAGVSDLYYPTYAELTGIMDSFALAYPGLCRVSTAGVSVEGRNIPVLTLSDHPDQREAEPVLSYVSTLHGDEPVGTVLLVELIRYLLVNYSTDARIKAMVDRHVIRILPLSNPDGYEAGDRYNADGTDLNRNFPDPSAASDDAYNSVEGRAKETQVLMNWIMARPAAVSANLHTGSLLVNYPLDYTDSLSPDDALFQHMSLAYAANNPTMALLSPYENGIVRGAVWYVITGGLQDWAYLGAGELHVTLELSTVKYPEPSELDDLWDVNRESLLAYLETADTGIGGNILDSETGEPLNAWVRISDNSNYVFSDPSTGYYMRVLLPGNYSVTAGATGYRSKTVENVTVTQGVVSVADFSLESGLDPENPDTIVSNWPDKQDDDHDDGHDDDDVAEDSHDGCFIGASM